MSSKIFKLLIVAGLTIAVQGQAQAFGVSKNGCADGMNGQNGPNGSPSHCPTPGIAAGAPHPAAGAQGRDGGAGMPCLINITGVKASDKIKLNYTARGGQGGQGGNGGKMLVCGWEYIQGANGGNGGSGGPGASVKIVSDQPIDVSQISFSAGCPSSGGKGGAPGKGAKGGRVGLINVPSAQNGHRGHDGSTGQIILDAAGQKSDVTAHFCK